MLLEQDQANQRLTSERNLANRFGRGRTVLDGSLKTNETNETPKTSTTETPTANLTFKSLRHTGCNNGTKDLTPAVATTVAILARSGVDKQRDIAKEFNMSQPGVCNLNREGSSKVDEEVVARVLGEVEDRALNRLMASLNFMSDDKLANSKATDLSSIAANMSRVHANLSGKNNNDSGAKVNITIYSPELHNESKYKTIEV